MIGSKASIKGVTMRQEMGLLIMGSGQLIRTHLSFIIINTRDGNKGILHSKKNKK